MTKNDSSGLHALDELRQMEVSRLRAVEAQRLAEIRAQQTRAQEVEHSAALAAEAAVQAQAAAYQAALEQRRQLELVERMRLDEAAAQARIDQQARLRHETMRLDAQLRAAQRAAVPRWPYVVVPALIAMLGLAGAIAWHDSAAAERIEQSASEQRTAYDQQMAQVAAKLDALTANHQRLASERAALEAKLAAADTEAERIALQERVDAIDEEIARDAPAGTTKPKLRPKTNKPKPATDTVDTSDGTKSSTRKPIVLTDGKDPLDDL